MLSLFRHFRAAVLAMGALALAGPAAALTTVSIDSFDAGWYRSDGYHSTANTNIITGSISGRTYNNFFAFDLSGISGNVVSATLEIVAGNGRFLNSAGNANYYVHQVTTSAATIVGGTGGVAAFNDLADGTLFGQTRVSTPGRSLGTMPSVTVTLSNALADLNAAKGSQIVFGGSTDANPYLWGYSSGAGAARVTLTLDPLVTVPLPAPLFLLLAALGGTALASRRKA